MTIEEARKIIESNITAYTLANPEVAKFVDALYMAIRSLEALPKVREDIEALEDLKGHISYDGDLYKGAWNDCIYAVLNIIDRHLKEVGE